MAALPPTENSVQSTPLDDAHRAANPILGVQPPGEQNTPEPTPIIPVQEPVSQPFFIWSWVETGLGLAGVALAFAAYFFYRREK